MYSASPSFHGRIFLLFPASDGNCSKSHLPGKLGGECLKPPTPCMATRSPKTWRCQALKPTLRSLPFIEAFARQSEIFSPSGSDIANSHFGLIFFQTDTDTGNCSIEPSLD